MELSKVVGSVAVVLGVLLVIGHVRAEDSVLGAPGLEDSSRAKLGLKQTAQDKLDEREAKRRAAVAEQERRKEEFARRCSKPVKNDSELEACRAAYRRL